MKRIHIFLAALMFAVFLCIAAAPLGSGWTSTTDPVAALAALGGTPLRQSTNILSSMTTIDMSKAYADYAAPTTAAVTITGLANVTNTLAQSAVRMITNSAATNITLSVPSTWKSPVSTNRTFVITNGTVYVLSVLSYGNRYTNFVCKPLL